MSEPAYRLLSLGAGVQSTTIVLLAAEGRLGPLDGAIFSDTGWEPATVYAHLDRLEREVAKPAGIPIYRVGVGNIRNDALDPDHRFASMPLYVRNVDGGEAMIRRQCTSEYKLKPIKAKVRELLGYPHPTPVPRGLHVEQWIGISRDEFHRAKDSDVQYARNAFPLLDMQGAADGLLGWRRTDCIRYLRSRGFGDTPKSACIGCPFHRNHQWRTLRDTCRCGHRRDEHGRKLLAGPTACRHWDSVEIKGEPEPVADPCPCGEFHNPEWLDAVAFDAAIRGGGARATATGNELLGQAFLHRSLLPLAQAPVDRVTAHEWHGRQGDLFDAVADESDEDDEPAGCSPWTCRSDDPDAEMPLLEAGAAG